MAEEENSTFSEDDSDYIELCPDTSEFADDESLVQEITASRDAGKTSMPIFVRPVHTAAQSSSATAISSDESDEEVGCNGRKRRRSDRRDGHPRKNVAGLTDDENGDATRPHPSLSLPSESSLSTDEKLDQETKIDAGQTSGRKRGPAQSGIYINKNFKGTVQAAPGTCLAWDSDIMNSVQSSRDRNGRNPALIRHMTPPLLPLPFRGMTPRAPSLSSFAAGLPLFAVPPPFSPISQLSRMHSVQMLQERFLTAAFAGMHRPVPPFPTGIRRPNPPRNRGNLFRPPGM